MFAGWLALLLQNLGMGGGPADAEPAADGAITELELRLNRTTSYDLSLNKKTSLVLMLNHRVEMDVFLE